MSLTAINNQAVSLATPGNTFQDINGDCECVGRDFCQLVEPSDDTCVEVGLSETTGTELVTDGGFAAACGTNWTCGANWSIAAGIASKAAGAGNALSQFIAPIDQNKLYKIVFTISNVGGTGNGTAYFTGFAQETIITFPATSASAQTYTRYIFVDNLPDGTLIFEGDTTITYDLDNVSIKEMSTVGLRIKDDEGNVDFEEFTGVHVTYSQTVAKAKVCINWLVVSTDDCYNICLIDEAVEGKQLVLNSRFTNASDWTLGLGWAISGGNLNIDSTVTPGDDTGSTGDLCQNLKTGVKYTVTFTGANLVGVIQVFVIRTDLTNKLIGTVANGANSLEIDMTSETLEATDILFAEDSSGAHAIDIDNVEIRLQDEYKVATLESECFKLGTHPCSSLFTWTNDENAFGFEYDTISYTQSLRHCAKLWIPSQSKDKTPHRDSDGDRTLLYSSTTKITRLSMDYMPEYLHAAFGIALEHDTFTIDAEEYVNEEDLYEPNQPKNSLLASVDVEVIKDNQNLVNDNC